MGKPYPNPYAGSCKICNRDVPPKRGWEARFGRRASIYCQEHVPAVAGCERAITADGRVFLPYNYRDLPLIRQFPGARWVGHKKFWQVSTSQKDRARVLEISEQLGLQIDPELRRIDFATGLYADGAVASLHKTKEENTGMWIPPRSRLANAIKDQYPMLYGYQANGAAWLRSGNRRLLSDDMGTGKTIQALVALPDRCAAIVVAPACVKHNWVSEVRKWRPDLDPVLLSGKDSFAWPSAGQIVITNFDILPDWLEPTITWDYLPTMKHLGEEVQLRASGISLIVDEVHKCASPRTQRSLRVWGLSRLVRTVWGMTGTPILNRPQDLWSILDALGLAVKTFTDWNTFVQLFQGFKTRYGYEFGDPLPEVADRLKEVMLRRTRESVLPDLPKKQITVLQVNGLSEDLRTRLDRKWAAWQSNAENTSSGELPAFGDFAVERSMLAKARIPAMLEYVLEHEEQNVPLVVFSAHTAPPRALSNRPGWGVITGDTPPSKRQEIVDAFQHGKLLGVAGTIEAMGVGVTLVRSWKVLFVDLAWTPALNDQAEDRVCRIGQSHHVEIVRMVSDHPLDRHVTKVLSAKTRTIQGAIKKTEHARYTPPDTGLEQQAREEAIAAAAAVAQKLQAEKAVRRARKKCQGTLDSLPLLTGKRMDLIRKLIPAILLFSCPEKRKDNLGFKKADYELAKTLVLSEMQSQESMETAYAMLSGYSHITEAKFPTLFREESKDEFFENYVRNSR